MNPLSSSMNTLSSMSSLNFSPNTWTITVYVTDVHVRKEVVVRSDTNVGFVMLDIVERLGRFS